MKVLTNYKFIFIQIRGKTIIKDLVKSILTLNNQLKVFNPKKTITYILITISFFTLHLSIFSKKSNAQTPITVTLDISDTILRLQGFTSPYANIIFLENDAVIGTTQANLYGEFSKDITYDHDGIHTVSFYSTDKDSNTSSTITITVAVYTHTITTINNILIPPAISIDNPIHTTNPKEIITFSGQATPHATITLVTSTLSKQTQTTQNGSWVITFTGSNFNVGTYTAVAKAQKSNGTLSENSKTINFTINKYIPPPEPEPEPTQEETNTTETKKTTTKTTSKAENDDDNKTIIESIIEKINQLTNNDKKVEVVCGLHPYLRNFDYNRNCFIPRKNEEFISTVTYWTKNWKKATKIISDIFWQADRISDQKYIQNLPKEQQEQIREEIKKCDLDNDNLCTLKDFSILLYYTNNIELSVQTKTEKNNKD